MYDSLSADDQRLYRLLTLYFVKTTGFIASLLRILPSRQRCINDLRLMIVEEGGLNQEKLDEVIENTIYIVGSADSYADAVVRFNATWERVGGNLSPKRQKEHKISLLAIMVWWERVRKESTVITPAPTS